MDSGWVVSRVSHQVNRPLLAMGPDISARVIGRPKKTAPAPRGGGPPFLSLYLYIPPQTFLGFFEKGLTGNKYSIRNISYDL